jgi:uncharacterized coiled-coil protein SlyX
MAAGPASADSPMEARIARLESDVAHLRTDVADIKVDIRSLRDKMDTGYTKLSEKIEGVEQRLDAKIGGVEQRLDVKLEKLAGSLTSMARWGVALYVALAATTFGTMARGFGWI